MRRSRVGFAGIALALGAFLAALVALSHDTAAATGSGVPRFEPDPYWPKPLPHNWILGGIGAIFVDSQDHIWVAQRPKSVDKAVKNLAHEPPDGDCCIPAPPILEFDMQGNVIQGWGGPGNGYEWPDNEHGIFVDYKG